MGLYYSSYSVTSLLPVFVFTFISLIIILLYLYVKHSEPKTKQNAIEISNQRIIDSNLHEDSIYQINKYDGNSTSSNNNDNFLPPYEVIHNLNIQISQNNSKTSTTRNEKGEVIVDAIPVANTKNYYLYNMY